VSKGLGKIQKKILKLFIELYDDFEDYYESKKDKEIGNIFGIDCEDIISFVYDIDSDDVHDLPLTKKQIVYNSLKGLKKRGWIERVRKTDSFDESPPMNYLEVMV